MERRKFDFNEPLKPHYIDYVYDSALRVANYVGLNSGLKILKQGFASWPDIRDEKIEQLKKELAK